MRTTSCENLTGRSARTIRIDINAGRLPGCRIGRQLFVPKMRFIDFILMGIAKKGKKTGGKTMFNYNSETAAMCCFNWTGWLTREIKKRPQDQWANFIVELDAWANAEASDEAECLDALLEECNPSIA